MKGFSSSSFAHALVHLFNAIPEYLFSAVDEAQKPRNGFAEIPFACIAFRSVEPSCACQCCSHGS